MRRRAVAGEPIKHRIEDCSGRGVWAMRLARPSTADTMRPTGAAVNTRGADVAAAALAQFGPRT